MIHNAAVGDQEPRRVSTADGLAHVFATDVLAPYCSPRSSRHPPGSCTSARTCTAGAPPGLDDLQWERRRWNGPQACADSKLFDTVLAFAVARRWPSVLSNAVDPGWVPTKMGGRRAPGDLHAGVVTQAWLATSDDPAATVTGRYFHHRRPQDAHPAAHDPRVQDGLLAACAALTGVEIG